METVFFASDHAGFELKNELLRFVRDELEFEVFDCGAHVFDAEDDFTDFVSKAAQEVSTRPSDARAIILGGSGQGEAMLANRFHNVRAAVYYGGDEEIIMLSRMHNDANVLSLGARFLETKTAQKAVSAWLFTPYKEVRKYSRRIREIETFSSKNENSVSIVPSLPAQSFEEISALLDALQGAAPGAQIDIVDGEFAPHVSWPFTEEDPVQALQQLASYTHTFAIEIDCMCMRPEAYLDRFAEIGAKRVIVHMGSTSQYAACIAHAHTHGYKIGFAVTNDTPLSELLPYVHDLHFIQVMGIKDVGSQGQAFDERTLDTIAKLRNVHPNLEIAVDGAVNERTIPALMQSGANRFAPGSAIAQSPDPRASYKQLSRLLGL